MARSLKIEDALRELVEGLNYDLWACLLLGPSSSQILRVYIDSDSGIQIDDCEKVSHHLSTFLDVEDLIKNEYTLEVSSPGLDRPLFTLDHFKKYLGCEIKIKLFEARENKKNFVGLLKDVSTDGTLTFECEGMPITLMLDNIAKANLVY